jgi:hypothetical protein
MTLHVSIIGRHIASDNTNNRITLHYICESSSLSHTEDVKISSSFSLGAYCNYDRKPRINMSFALLAVGNRQMHFVKWF